MSRLQENSVESLFLQAVERGDRKAIIFALENAPDLNVNCLDADDNSALVIAITNGNSGEKHQWPGVVLCNKDTLLFDREGGALNNKRKCLPFLWLS